MEKDTTYPLKENTHQVDISIHNIYAPNTREPKFVKETLSQLKSHIDLLHTVMVGKFNSPPSLTDRVIQTASKQRMAKAR